MDLKEKVGNNFTDTTEKERFFEAFHVKKKNNFIGSDVLKSISILMVVLASENYNFKEKITDIVMRGGKGVCVHASIVGGVLGAVLGYSQLPQDWLLQLPQENIRLLNSKLNLLLDLFGLP